MHNEEFFAVGNGYAGDSNHPRMPFLPTEWNPGKPLSCVDTSLSLVPRRDGCVRYGMVRYDGW